MALFSCTMHEYLTTNRRDENGVTYAVPESLRFAQPLSLRTNPENISDMQMTNDQTLYFEDLKLFSGFKEALPYYVKLHKGMEDKWILHLAALALLKLVLQILPPWIVRQLIDDNCRRCSSLFVYLNINDEQRYLGKKVEAHDFYSLLPGDCCFSFMCLQNKNALGVGLIADTARIKNPQVFIDIFMKKYESLMNSEVRI